MTGDLLFQSGEPSPMECAIETATGDGRPESYTHAAIAVRSGACDSVLEATTAGGVRMTSLAEFLNGSAQRAGRPVVIVLRLRDTAGTAAAVSRARKFLGQPYDYSFLPGNGKLYCTELIWESFLTADGAHLFPARPMNFRAADGSIPVFWSKLFERLGEPVPQGIPGTNPNDMAREPFLECVHKYY